MPAREAAAASGGQRAPATGLIYFFGALEGLVFGYDTGVVAGALPFITTEMHLSHTLEGLIVSALLFGAIVASPFTGYYREKWGARRLISLSGFLFLVGSVGAALSPNPIVLIVFRFVLGIAVGMGTVLVPVYLVELSPAQHRGRITTHYQLLIAIGIFIAYVVGYFFSLSGDWRWMFGVAAVPSLLLTAGVFVLPESPRWLVERGRVDEARRVLERTRMPGNVDSELDEIRTISKTTSFSLRQLWQDPWLRRVLLLALAMSALQQALGINTVVYYLPTILGAVGMSKTAAILASACLQVLSIVVTFIIGRTVDRLGRRGPLIGGAIAMMVSMAAMGVIFALGSLHSGTGAASALGALAIFKIAFSLSWGPVLYIVLPEILPLKARSAGMGACSMAIYIVNFILSTVFPLLLAVGASFTFGLFAFFGLVAAILVFRVLPETTRQTLEHIEAAGERRVAR